MNESNVIKTDELEQISGGIANFYSLPIWGPIAWDPIEFPTDGPVPDSSAILADA